MLLLLLLCPPFRIVLPPPLSPPLAASVALSLSLSPSLSIFLTLSPRQLLLCRTGAICDLMPTRRRVGAATAEATTAAAAATSKTAAATSKTAATTAPPWRMRNKRTTM